ncbi:MAG: toll/interleukin-1 receptor domain-containing protein [Chloroflexi bacterium]|nr:toll/interleukin-1 receptor domain-containing protein [Chloroflexota bacterium]
MANAEQLALQKRGVAEWNKWRRENPTIEIDLSNADLVGAHLLNANLFGANLVGANLEDANLIGAYLIGANLEDANLRNANFRDAYLSDANLERANLEDANLSNANLSNANLRNANFRDAYLSDAKLSNANLIDANLSNANLDGADLTNAVIGYTSFGDVDLSVAKGLESVRHAIPSSIGIDTIYKSKGNIPEIFLRGCGVPDTFITFARSLVGTAGEYYSCFMSYSSQDDDFAKRLYADLQSKGVRCWFAPEDLKTGDKFRGEIDRAIQYHDKLLLVLSASSIDSAWVETEVESAFERERKQSKTVLFPVRLDDAVMQTSEAWAANIRRTRHIGDMTNWKKHDDYQNAFERLLRDLKAASG